MLYSRFRGNGIYGVHEIYDQGMCWSWFVASATIKEFMFVLVWWLAICNLKYTWGCEGLWTPQYPPNQPRVIHDWFPKDWIRFWIYHQNNQPEILEIQVHFVPYPDPYPFHTRSVPEKCHVGSIPHHHHFLIFKCIQHIRYIPHPLYVAAVPLMKSWNIDMCICISVIYVCIYFYIYIYI